MTHGEEARDWLYRARARADSLVLRTWARRRSWVQQTVDQRMRVVVARLGLQLGVKLELNSLILC